MGCAQLKIMRPVSCLRPPPHCGWIWILLGYLQTEILWLGSMKDAPSLHVAYASLLYFKPVSHYCI